MRACLQAAYFGKSLSDGRSESQPKDVLLLAGYCWGCWGYHPVEAPLMSCRWHLRISPQTWERRAFSPPTPIFQWLRVTPWDGNSFFLPGRPECHVQARLKNQERRGCRWPARQSESLGAAGAVSEGELSKWETELKRCPSHGTKQNRGD